MKIKEQIVQVSEKISILPRKNMNSYEMKKSKEKFRNAFKKVKRSYKELRKRGILKKLVVLICALALIATSILPYIL